MNPSFNICYIVGAMSLTPALRPYPKLGDYVIAADRGFDSLMAYGVNPDLAVGDHGAQGFLAGEKTAATCIRDGQRLSFPAEMRGFLSVFCNSGTAEGVTLQGLKYPLDRSVLTGDFPLGVSNQFLGEPAQVSVEKGSLLLLWEEKGGFYSQLPKLWAV